MKIHALLLCVLLLLAACTSTPPTNPQQPVLYADLWMQTAAEYYAICHQTYAVAARLVAELSKEHAGSDKPLAVVMDLDETVIDNSAFQTRLYRDGETYSSQAWQSFVQRQSESTNVKEVPGAVSFINKMKTLGITVVFISNRNQSDTEPTLKTLAKLGIDTTGLDDLSTGRLLLRTDTSSKIERRRTTEERFHVIAYFGDNLSDFAGEFEDTVAKTAEGRREEAERVRARWGAEWFVLPNPTYGDYLGVLKKPLEGNLVGL